MLKLESLQFFIPTARGRNFGMEKNVINAPSGGVFPIYYNITWGGVRPIYYDITWGGVRPIYYNITPLLAPTGALIVVMVMHC